MENRFNPQLKLTRHEEFARYLNGGKVMPINVEISPTGRCNASCEECFYRNQKDQTDLNIGVLETLILEMEKSRVQAVSWTGGGEPTMYPQFWKAVRFLRMNTRICQGLFTNGLKVNYDPSLMDWIRVSCSNKGFNKENLKLLRDKCRTVGLCLNWKGDKFQLGETLLLAEELNLDYVQIRPALKRGGELTQIEPPKVEHPLLIISDYKFQEARKKRDYAFCEGYHFVPFVWQDGDIDTCGYMRKRKEYNLGNIYEDKFADIMERAPKQVKVSEDCQTCCKNHEINKLISIAREIKDKEFV